MKCWTGWSTSRNPDCASHPVWHFAWCTLYQLNKEGYNIQPWHIPFLIWNQSVAPCPVLTVASWSAYTFLRRQVRWSGIPISLRIFHSISTETVLTIASLFNVFNYIIYFYDVLIASSQLRIGSTWPVGSPSLFSRSTIPLAWMEWYSTKYDMESFCAFSFIEFKLTCIIVVTHVMIKEKKKNIAWNKNLIICSHFVVYICMFMMEVNHENISSLSRLSAMFPIATTSCFL